MRLAWLPNAITVGRILLVLPVLYFIDTRQYLVALVLFVIAGLSDGIDGFLAKRYGWHSRFGALLDPVADKLLIVGVFALLLIQGLVPLWLALLVILRDVVIVGGAMAYNHFVRRVDGEPTRVSKLNTGMTLLFVVFVLSNAGSGWPPPISLTVLGAGVLFTVVVSGIDYVRTWARRARDSSAQGET